MWGAAYGDNMSLHYCEAATIDELHPLQKSKYVQSNVGNSFRKIKEELQHGDLVLFCGTGCHIKGLRAFLRKDYENLYVDTYTFTSRLHRLCWNVCVFLFFRPFACLF